MRQTVKQRNDSIRTTSYKFKRTSEASSRSSATAATATARPAPVSSAPAAAGATGTPGTSAASASSGLSSKDGRLASSGSAGNVGRGVGSTAAVLDSHVLEHRGVLEHVRKDQKPEKVENQGLLR